MSFKKKTIHNLFVAFFILFFSINIEAKEMIKSAHLLDTSFDISPQDMKSALTLWIREVGKSANIEIESHYYTSIEDLKKDMLNAKVNFMVVQSIDVVESFNLDELIEGYSPVRKNNNIHNTLVVVVHNKSKIKTVEDFKGKRLGLYTNSDIEQLYIDTLLLEKNLPIHSKYFSSVKKYKKRSSALLDLFFNKIDVAIITKGTLELAAEMNPQIKNSIKVLNEKYFRLGMVGFFSKNIDKKTLDKFYGGIERITESERAKQILTLMKSDKLEKTNKDELYKLQRFYNEYLELKK